MLGSSPRAAIDLKEEKMDEQTPRTHSLKTWPEYFRQVKSGEKTAELRKNDRDFRKGDILILEEWRLTIFHVTVGQYTGASIKARITHVLAGEEGERFGLKPGYAMLSFEVIKECA